MEETGRGRNFSSNKQSPWGLTINHPIYNSRALSRRIIALACLEQRSCYVYKQNLGLEQNTRILFLTPVLILLLILRRIVFLLLLRYKETVFRNKTS